MEESMGEGDGGHIFLRSTILSACGLCFFLTFPPNLPGAAIPVLSMVRSIRTGFFHSSAHCSSFPTQPCKWFPSCLDHQKAAEKGMEKRTGCPLPSLINHSRQSHGRAAHHKTTTRPHLADPEWMLRANVGLSVGCSLTQSPITNLGLGHRESKALFLLFAESWGTEAFRREGGCLKLSSSTPWGVPCGALLGLPGNLERAAVSLCPFTATRHSSDSKEPFQQLLTLFRVHSYWKMTEVENVVWGTKCFSLTLTTTGITTYSNSHTLHAGCIWEYFTPTTTIQWMTIISAFNFHYSNRKGEIRNVLHLYGTVRL